MTDKIAFRLLLPILSVIFLSMSLTFYLVYQNEKEKAIDIYLDEIRSKVSLTKNNLSFWMQEQINTARTLSTNQDLIDFLSEPTDTSLMAEAEGNLQKFYDHATFYENIVVIAKLPEGAYITRDIDGKSLKVYDAQAILDTVGGKTLTKGSLKMPFIYKTLVEGELAISKPYPSLLRANPIVVIMVPIRKDERLLGGLVLAIKLSYFIEKYIQDISLAESGFLSIIDSDGDIIAHMNREYVLKKNIKEERYGKGLMEHGLDMHRYMLDGEAIWIKSTVEQLTSWRIVAYGYEDDIIKKLDRSALNLFALFVFVTIGIFVFIYLFTYQIVSAPLQKITESLDAFSTDDFHVLDGFMTSTEEFVRIKASFEKMTQMLSSSYLDLTYSQELLSSVSDSVDALIFYKDMDLVYIGCNRHFSEYLGKTKEEVIGKKDLELFDADIVAKTERTDQRILATGRGSEFTIKGEYPDGRKVVFQVIKSLLRDGQTLGIVGIAYDITRQNKVEHRLRREQKLFIGGPIVVIRRNLIKRCIIEYVSKSIEQFGYHADHLIEQKRCYHDLIHKDDIETVKQALAECIDKGLDFYEIDYRIVDVSGKVRWVYDYTILIKDDEGKTTQLDGYILDITDRKALEKAVRYQAHYDALTDLPNRVLLHEHFLKSIATARRSGTKLAALFIDLDHFKLINDTFGHNIGDEILKIVAKRFSENIRASDIIARLGGDEFFIIYNDLKTLDSIASNAAKLINVLQEECHIGEQTFHLSASIGVSIFPDDGKEPFVLMRHADTAMYKAKELGRNNVQFFIPEMGEKANEEMLIRNSIRSGLKDNEFFLVYQPQFDGATSRLVGTEALVRWRSKHFGLITPDQFIPIAESSGMIIPLGRWILEEACSQQKEWEERFGITLRVSVNVSIMQFQHTDFVQTVHDVLKKSALRPERLELEITEGISMQKVERSLQVLHELKALGISIAMDDFGTGYSSLSYLKKFPIDRLKIDQTFVRDCTTDKDDRMLIETIIAMSKGLGMQSVAEGVETREHQIYLQALSCDIMQGYYFDRPLEAAVFESDYLV